MVVLIGISWKGLLLHLLGFIEISSSEKIKGNVPKKEVNGTNTKAFKNTVKVENVCGRASDCTIRHIIFPVEVRWLIYT
jgi:hypothetical protein